MQLRHGLSALGALGALGALAIAVALLCPLTASAQQVYKNVSSDTLERILGDLNIQYKKSQGNKPGIHFYDYSNGDGYKIRIHNYEGKDLWIDALFTDMMTLDDVNRWNIRAKFSRCVLLDNNNKARLSLENQYDCLGGTTDAMVRQFIVRFNPEVKTFADYIKNTQPR